MLDLPWEEYTKDSYDLKKAKKVLDHDHYGMNKIKDRILEYLAVLKLKGDMKSPILCFIGPPGIGKTSLGKSIAAAISRKYVRVSFWRPLLVERSADFDVVDQSDEKENTDEDGDRGSEKAPSHITAQRADKHGGL